MVFEFEGNTYKALATASPDWAFERQHEDFQRLKRIEPNFRYEGKAKINGRDYLKIGRLDIDYVVKAHGQSFRNIGDFNTMVSKIDQVAGKGFVWDELVAVDPREDGA